jgi:hypothetical protein
MEERAKGGTELTKWKFRTVLAILVFHCYRTLHQDAGISSIVCQ